MMDRLGMNQGSVVHGMMDWSMMDWGMMDWGMMDRGMMDRMVRAGMVDGSMANPEISLLPPSRVIVLSARLVGRDWLLHHLHLQLQVVGGGHDGQRDDQERYEEVLAMSLHQI